MIVAKFAWKFAKAKALDSLADKVGGLYTKWLVGRVEHEARILDYRLNGSNYFSDGSVQELSKRYGLEEKLKSYQVAVHDRIKDYLAQLMGITDYLRNAITNKANIPEAIMYAKVHNAYETMARLAGYTPPERTRKKYGYLSDLAPHLGYIGDMNKKIERMLEIASGLDTEGSSLRYAAAKRTLKWLGKEILGQIGIPPQSLDKIVTSASQSFAQLKKEVRAAFVDYASMAKAWHSYTSDLSADYAIAA